MYILAIETSCDETAAAVVQDGKKVLSNVVASQIAKHAETGGVVPEVAAREHMKVILPVITQALQVPGLTWDEMDAIAVTKEPGLVGSLLVGRMTAQTLAFVHDKPLVEVNHILGHVYATGLEVEEDWEFPILSLTVSGGHNELILLRSHEDREVLGETVDDAAGEAFDKVARLMSLPYPGGPAIERTALEGDPSAVPLPRTHMEGYNYSFSGLKTAVLYYMKEHPEVLEDPQKLADLAASFQKTVCDQLVGKLKQAVKDYQPREVHLTGGVSANKALRTRIQQELGSIRFRTPQKMSFCTDNAAMIGGAAFYQLQVV